MSQKIKIWQITIRLSLMLAALAGVLWTISALKSSSVENSQNPIIETLIGQKPKSPAGPSSQEKEH